MKVLRLTLFASLFALLFSCKPKVPGKYLQPDEFEDILYDYHLADGMANSAGDSKNTPYDAVLYRQGVFRKHGITQAEFDSSLVYYMRHADRMHKIYENLSKRFEDEAMALGATANDIRRYGDMTSARDTSNLWAGVSSVLLTTYAPYNVMSFEIGADSTYRNGDKLIFSFNCDFLFKEGSKDGTALLAIQFKNDSIASSTVRMTSNSNYSVTVSDASNKGIKAVRGFIYLGGKKAFDHGNGINDNDLRLLFIDNIRLVRLCNNAKLSETQLESNPRHAKRDTVSAGKRQEDAKPVGVHVSPKPGNAEIRTLDGKALPAKSGSTAPLKMSDVRPVAPQKRIGQ